MAKTASAPKGYAEFRTHWRALLAATIGFGVGFPTLAFFTIGIFAPIFAESFGWSFASIMGGLLLTSVVILLFGPVVGHVVDKYGARAPATASLACLGLCYMTFALSNGSIVQYYASWTIMALTSIGASAISFTHAINRTFVERRGFALGITLAGSGVFALLIKPFASWSIDLFGWRETIVIIGAMPLVLGVPLVLWGLPGRRTPAHDDKAPAPQADGLTLKGALGGKAFWLLIAAFIPISFANGAPLPNMENILRTLDLSANDVVQLASLIGVSMVVGRLFGGWIVDRLWAPLVGFVLLLGAAAGCWVLAQVGVSYPEAMAAIILLSFAAGVEYDLLAYLVSRYMGRRHYGLIYSVIFGVFAIGAGGGPVLLGHSFDSAGSYSQGLMVCAGALAAAGCLLLALGRYPQFADETKPIPVETSAGA